ncbi:hypothetical protein [Paractinoplanes lichenicola]|uniref:HEAT repeat domain-containing protein n=1 Tax=Paractinoplanes lichenicola TaxID=2802976 RepID=A0ABS1VHN0_9ACTN|nr:hypothetical protein [Actinoplanes lichenicola]MBL7254113.1 hypothetical protein [Actinoplanes lichenicola]
MTAPTPLEQAMRNGGDALDVLYRSLVRGETHLVALIERPRITAWLEERRRRDPWHSRPIPPALASLERDGRIREQAVHEMAAGPRPELMPFLVLRCADWVAQVRDPARAIVATMLAERPETFLRPAVPMAMHIADRYRADWATRQVRAATVAAFDRVETTMLGSKVPAVRRLVFAAGTELGRWEHRDLVRFALHEPDTMVRTLAADALAATAARLGDLETLRTIARSRFVQVRAAALTELARLGHDADVAAAADDPAPFVRAIARTRLPQPAAHYRAAVTTRPTPGAIAGLGETGGYSDEAVLAPLLGHDDARIRAAAVQALAALDAVPVEGVVPLLQDPVPGVIREAASALRPYQRRLPADRLWRLLDDPRLEVRRGAYRIVRNWDPASALRAGRMLAGDDDPQLAQRGRDDVRRWERIVNEQQAG